MHELTWHESRYLNVTSTYQQLSFPKSFAHFDEYQIAKPLVNLCLQTGLVAKNTFNRVALVTSVEIEDEDNFLAKSLPFNCPIAMVKLGFKEIVEDLLFNKEKTLYVIAGRGDNISIKSFKRLLEINNDLDILLPKSLGHMSEIPHKQKQVFFTKEQASQKTVLSLKSGKFQDFSLIPYCIEPQRDGSLEKYLDLAPASSPEQNRIAWMQGAVVIESEQRVLTGNAPENNMAPGKGGVIFDFLCTRAVDYEMNHGFFSDLSDILTLEVQRMQDEGASQLKWLKVRSPFKKLNYYLENYFSSRLANGALLKIKDNLPYQYVNTGGFLFCLLEQKMRGGIFINLEAFPEVNIAIIK